jgi:selenocysteine lyase/cysteine desulfurase
MDRRHFFKSFVAGSALSLLALKELNAGIYENIRELNMAFQNIPSPDGVYWDAVRKHFLFEDKLIMMNNGTVGPIPEPVYNTLMKYIEVQVKAPCDCYMYLPTLVGEVRTKLARFIGASPDEVVINRNTTEGMNFVANGLDLKAGDEVLISNLEHPGGTHPWRLKEKRYGITLKDFPLGVPPASVDEIVESFKKAVTPRTRVLSISQTVYITGLIAPIKELAEEAHKRDILVAVDSAHGIGMLNLDLHDMGPDFWCSSPYKWMGSPPGVGVFYVKKDVQDRLWPTIASSGWDTHETAEKFETLSQRADALTLALGEAIEFQNHIGKDRIERRIKTLAAHLKEQLTRVPGVKLHLPIDKYLSGGLTAFSIEGVEPSDIVNYVRERYNIVIRTIGSKDKGTHGVRVSTNIYVSLKDVDLLLEGIRHLARRA